MNSSVFDYSTGRGEPRPPDPGCRSCPWHLQTHIELQCKIGLSDQLPRHSPGRKVTPELEKRILTLRKARNLGPKRIHAELLREDALRLSTATIWKVLSRNGVKPLHRTKTPTRPTRYERPVPGDRIQMDTVKVGPEIVQFTAIDDCSRMRVLGMYERRTPKNAVDFLEGRVLEEFPFPIQRIQTDRVGEFFAMVFQQTLHKHRSKFRPVRPASPHLNGKVERSQQTDRVEFWPTVKLDDPDLGNHVDEWQFFYNWYRPHSSLGGTTPFERCCDLLDSTPWSWEIWNAFEPQEEDFRERDYSLDLQIRKLKRSL